MGQKYCLGGGSCPEYPPPSCVPALSKNNSLNKESIAFPIRQLQLIYIIVMILFHGFLVDIIPIGLKVIIYYISV